MTPLELLAPAGDWTALRAAVANGADAVYFGVVGSNARARAANFEPDELPAVMEFLHRRNTLGFVALNTLAFPDELDTLADQIRQMAEAGVDAVIVQDLGLVELCQRVEPTMAVHGSTQMTLTEPHGIEYVRRLGVSRVVLARELSIADIARVHAATTMPLEVFVHGALCVAYSGQCLTSEALGGRSANRGQCAQACRLPYELWVDGHHKPLGDRSYLLSPQDLAAHDHVGELVAAGVISFKIEGRLKGGPYVAATTQTYRRAIDAAVGAQPFALNPAERRDLAQVFSRGLTPGFLAGLNHQALVRGRVPKSRGVRLGTVRGVRKNRVRITLHPELPPDSVKPGDGLLFDLGRPETEEPGGRVWAVRPFGGELELEFERTCDFEAVPTGSEVWKTDDPALKRHLEQSYATDDVYRRRQVRARLFGELGGPVTLTLTSGDLSASATWPGPLEAARNRPTTAADVEPLVARLGETPFMLDALDFALPETAMLPKSVTNDLRRRASEALTAALLASSRHAVTGRAALDELRTLFTPVPAKSPGRVSVLVRNPAQLEAVLAWVPPPGVPRPAWVVCDYEDLRRYKDAVSQIRAAGLKAMLAPTRVVKPGEEGFQSLVARAAPDGVLVRNLFGIDYFRAQLPGAALVGDFSLNVANDIAARQLLRAGLVQLTPSFDLNWEQFRALLCRVEGSHFVPVVHQHMPMFHTEHCVFAAELSTGKDYRDCGRPCESHEVSLRDRVGAVFPVHPDTGCRNTVFNSVPQSAAEYLPKMRALGVNDFRIDLLRESPGEAVALLESYARLAAGLDDGRATFARFQAQSQLGVTRGTLNLV